MPEKDVKEMTMEERLKAKPPVKFTQAQIDAMTTEQKLEHNLIQISDIPLNDPYWMRRK